MFWLWNKWLAVKLLFAGSGALVAHWGTGAIIIAVCLFAALGTQLIAGIPAVGPAIAKFLAPLRNDLLWVAAGVAGALCYATILVKDANAHCTAKTVVIQKVTTKAVKDAVKHPSTNDKWELK